MHASQMAVVVDGVRWENESWERQFVSLFQANQFEVYGEEGTHIKCGI